MSDVRIWTCWFCGPQSLAFLLSCQITNIQTALVEVKASRQQLGPARLSARCACDAAAVTAVLCTALLGCFVCALLHKLVQELLKSGPKLPVLAKASGFTPTSSLSCLAMPSLPAQPPRAPLRRDPIGIFFSRFSTPVTCAPLQLVWALR
jgi:hypothetical protein